MVLLNTGLAAAQVTEMVEREGISLVVHDEEFGGLTDGLSVPRLGEHAFLDLTHGLDEDAARALARVDGALIEDIVTVTEDGVRRLNNTDHGLHLVE